MTDRQYFFRTFKYVRPYVLLYTIGLILYSAQSFMFPLVMGTFMGGVMEGILAADFSIVVSATWRLLIMIVAAMIMLALGTYHYVMTQARATRDLTLQLCRAFMKSSLENEKHSGEGIAAINTDVNTASDIFSDGITNFLNPFIGILFSGVAIFIIDWRLGIGAVVVGLIIFTAQARFAEPLARLGKQRLEANADSVKALSNTFSGALTIRAFGRQRQSLISFDRESGKLRKVDFKQAFIGMWQDLFTTIQGWLSLILVFALGGWLVANGQIEFPQIMIILPLAEAMGTSMSRIGAAYAALQPPIVAAKRVFDVIDAAPETTASKSKSSADHWNGDYTISLNNLDFAYKNTNKNALSNVNLNIERNQMIAFVGESGSGKSTLLRLIIGMYERTNLNMKIGNLSFTTENLLEWRKRFAYVDQTCKLFDMTISENIALGNQGNASEATIVKAAKRAFADDFITTLPDGYATECGEKGSSLSGGQKQRIAIARALCRNAQVLVFDEATSALDMDSERHIMQTIESLRQDHTILITTHNLHNVQTADKIVVMDNGRIAEIGTQEELLAQNGIYKRLWEEQNGV